MRAVRFLAAAMPAALIVSTLVLTAVAMPAGAASASPAALAAATATATPAGSAGCQRVFEPPSSWIVVCSAGGGTPGGGGGSGGGGGGGGGKLVCSTTKLTPAQITDEGLPKAPAGEYWASITCPGNAPFGGITLVAANGTPAVTPEELLQVAENELTVPILTAATAPPVGQDGLVGLPEWYWIPNPQANWKKINVVVQVGPVWAHLWATPKLLTFDPGGGLSGASCGENNPGLQWSAGASSQAACTFTYDQSSATQQGGAYAAAATVHWVVQWTGSDGAHAVINADLARSFQFPLRVAEGQALVTGSGQ
jgi:hypothetical protein